MTLPAAPTPPAKSPGMLRICTRVLTTSSGVVRAATAPPAVTPLKKLTPSTSRGVNEEEDDNGDEEEEEEEEEEE